jgi:hypothetical protein
MRHHTTLLRALVASAFAAPSVALAEGPTEEVAFYYNRIGFNYQRTSDQAPASANTLGQIGHGGGSETVRKGTWILDTSRIDPAAAPSSKPKEIVVVGSKPPAASGLEHKPSFRSGEASVATRGTHPDFAWVPSRPPAAGAPATAPAAIAAPAPKPPPYTLIELLPLKGRR